MAIECVHCGQAADRVYYRRPEIRPAALRWLKMVLFVAGLLSVVSMVSLLGLVVKIVQAAVVVESAVVGSAQVTQPELRDYVRISSNTAIVFALGFVVALAVVGGRYLMLFALGLRRGRPKTWQQIRVIAWLQLVVELFGSLLVVVVFSRTEVVHVTPSLGWGLFTAPVILWLTSRPKVRAYFSWFRIDAAPTGRGVQPSFVKMP